jgi:hypothetical protein
MLSCTVSRIKNSIGEVASRKRVLQNDLAFFKRIGQLDDKTRRELEQAIVMADAEMAQIRYGIKETDDEDRSELIEIAKIMGFELTFA